MREHATVLPRSEWVSEWAGTSLSMSRLPRSLRKQYQTLAYSDSDARGGYYYDGPDEWAEETKAVVDAAWPRLVARNTDKALADTEREHLEKMMVCWRETGRGRFLRTGDYGGLRPDQARALRPYLRKIGNLYAGWIAANQREAVRLYATGRVITNRGKGWPYWIPGTNTRAGILLAWLTKGARTLDQLTDNIHSVMPNRVPFCFTNYPRVQPNRKPIPWIELINGELVQTGTFKGPKVRDVKAAAYVVNYVFNGMAWVMRYMLKNLTRRNTGTTGEAIAMANRNKFTIATDLSAYDNSVSYDLDEAYHDEVLMRTAWAMKEALIAEGAPDDWVAQVDLAMDLDDLMRESPVLSSPRNTKEAAVLIDSLGTIHSGERLTAQKGSNINDCRLEAKADYLNLKVETVNFGDDTLISSDDPKLAAKWGETTELWGFTETVAPDASFLMRRIPQNYAYVARMLSSTINREPRFEPRDARVAIAGIAVRNELLKGNPNQDVFIQALKAGRRTRVTAEIAESIGLKDALVILASTARSDSRVEDASEILNSGWGQALERLTEADRAEVIAVFQGVQNAAQTTVSTMQKAVDMTDSNREAATRELRSLALNELE